MENLVATLEEFVLADGYPSAPVILWRALSESLRAISLRCQAQPSTSRRGWHRVRQNVFRSGYSRLRHRRSPPRKRTNQAARAGRRVGIQHTIRREAEAVVPRRSQ